MILDIIRNQAVIQGPLDLSPGFNTNPDGSFMNKEQILDDLVAGKLPPDIIVFLKHDFEPPEMAENMDMIRKTNFNPYAYARVELGRWIRNSYGLWVKGNPYTDGEDDGDMHPDNFSDDIIEALVAHYQGASH